jgi:lysosomal acid lipase/cholesteryl ester hydrolase
MKISYVNSWLQAEMIERRNYPVETHFARTDDGFLLEMHRIPQPSGFPVLLQHGFLGSSAAWILNGPKTGLGVKKLDNQCAKLDGPNLFAGYILWDLGYDVWLGNLRGNNYAQRHLSLNKDDPEFWNHS